MNKVLCLGALINIFIFFFIKSDLDKNTNLNVNLYDDFIDNCMEIWTKVDLVRAIHTSRDQKEQFLKELNSSIFSIYNKSLAIAQVNNSKNSKNSNITIDDIQNIIVLIKLIKENFKEVFHDFYNIRNRSFKSSYFLLKKVVNFLKVPRNI